MTEFFNDTATSEIYTRRQRQMCIRDSFHAVFILL